MQELDEEDLLSDNESDSDEPELDPNANLNLKKDQVQRHIFKRVSKSIQYLGIEENEYLVSNRVLPRISTYI